MHKLLTRIPLFALAALGLTAAGFAPSMFAPAATKGDEPIEIGKLPAAVQATAKRVFGTLDGLKASQENEGGMLLFEVEGKGADGVALSLTCVAGGQMKELERAIAVTALPQESTKSIQQLFPGATIVSAEEIQEHYFEVHLQKDGKTHGVFLTVGGRVKNMGAAKNKKEKDEGDEEDEEEEEED